MRPRRASRAALAVSALALSGLVVPDVGASAAAVEEGPVHVVHLVVDSLDPAEVGVHTPTLLELRASGTWYDEARAVMTAETLPNHVAMGTGTYPSRNGIPGNEGRVRPGDTEEADPDLGQPDLLQATSLTAAIEAQCPDLRTVTAFSKGYVHRIFASDGADADFTDRQLEIPESGHVPDSIIGPWVVQQLQEQADYVFVNLGDVDRAGHVDPTGTSGIFAGGRQAAIQQVDAVVRTIVEALKRNGMWERTVLVVNSDHRMDFRNPSLGELRGVDAQAALDADTRTAGRFFVAENGGAGLVYLLDPDTADADEVLAAARSILAGLDGVDEALYREPNPLDPGHDLDAVHPDWHLAGTDRIGELLVTVQAGWAFAGERVPGNHGHAITRHITAIVTGGWDGVVAGQTIAASGPVDQTDDTGTLTEQAEQVDWAPTFGWLLGVEDPGGEATPQWQGRVLSEAFVPGRAPAPACGGATAGSGDDADDTTDSTETAVLSADLAGDALPDTGGGLLLAGLGCVGAATLLRRRHGVG